MLPKTDTKSSSSPWRISLSLDRIGKGAVLLALFSTCMLLGTQRLTTLTTDQSELILPHTTPSGTTPHLLRPGFLSMQKAVVFSLFGNRPMDRDGALANAAAVPLYYPTWTPFFVVDDSIPETFRDQLRAAGSVVVSSNQSGAWGEGQRILRYMVLAEAQVQYAMFRDADSRITTREISSVNAWLQTNRTFHLMRDHPNHIAVILGGMWSVDAAALRRRLGDVRRRIVDYVATAATDRGMDQRWLADVIWPLIGDDVVDHDAFHCGQRSPYSTAFPLARDYNADYIGLVQDTSDADNKYPEHIAFWDEYRRHGEVKFAGNTAPEHCRRAPRLLYG